MIKKTHKAENLLFTAGKTPEPFDYHQYIVNAKEEAKDPGVKPPGGGGDEDATVFGEEPSFTVTEIPSRAFIDASGKEYSVVELSFTGLVPSKGGLSRVIVYSSRRVLNGSFDIREEGELLSEIPIPASRVKDNKKVLIYKKPLSTYNFYAFYLDKNGSPVQQAGQSIISAATGINLKGITKISNILEAKDVAIEGIETDDIDGVGYTRPVETASIEIKLSWYNLKNTPKTAWHSLTGSTFKDINGASVSVNSGIMNRFKNYVVYRFISNDGRPPARPFPALTSSNGMWAKIGSPSENSFTAKLDKEKKCYFWVGIEVYSEDHYGEEDQWDY